MRLALLALALLAAASAAAQEIVTVAPRPGATLSFFVANMGSRKPEAIALLFSGGGGSIRLRLEEGKPRFSAGNFLPRSRTEFIRNGVLPVLVDNPSDHAEGLSDEFRASLQHVVDVRAVMAEMRKRHPGLPIFLVGTSRSTLSIAHLAVALDNEAAGAVLSASLFYANAGRNPRPALSGFAWQRIRIPVLFVHHRDDGCGATPYSEAAKLAGSYPLISVQGGTPPESAPCDALAPHGFYGKEAPTVDAITAWMLKKPFAKDIP